MTTRQLRYYEQHDLLVPDRASNGYRDYAESLVDRVVQIRGLIDAGLPIKIIKQILPCLDDPGTIHVADAAPELIANLEQHRDQIESRIRCLAKNRDAINGYLDTVQSPVTGSPGGQRSTTSS